MAIRTSRHGLHNGFARPPAPAVYRNIAYSFLAVAVLVVIGALWVSSVRARVTVKVKRDVANVQAAIEIAKSPEQGQLRGRVLQGTFEKIQEFAVKEAKASAADTEVRGTVKIVNTYSKSQTLVATTRLLTADGRLYRIDKTVVVEPKESVTVTAHSDKKGKEYVLSAGTRLTIPGLWIDLQKWIYAETVSGFAGGTQVNRIVSSLDVSEAQKALEDAVLEQAKKTLAAEAGSAEEWAVVYGKKIVEQKSNVNPGQQSDTFLASVKLDVTAVFYPKKDMDALIRQKLKERLPDGRELTDFDPSQAMIRIDLSDAKQEKARLNVSAQASSRLSETSPQLSKDAVAGLSLEEAKFKLSSVDGVESVEIQIRPTWIGKIPTSKDHIELVIE